MRWIASRRRWKWCGGWDDFRNAHTSTRRGSAENIAMDLKKIFVPVLGIVMLAAAWRAYGWSGIAIVATGFVTWTLLHFNRITQVLRKAANRPVGYVGSAVMLNAKL